MPIVRSQSERVDDEYHLIRGIMYLKRHLEGNVNLPLNDPPLGEGLALPIWMGGYWPKGTSVTTALYNFPNCADRILMLIGLWKVLLFLPMVGVVFAWCRRVYDARAAWLAVAPACGRADAGSACAIADAGCAGAGRDRHRVLADLAVFREADVGADDRGRRGDGGGA